MQVDVSKPLITLVRIGQRNQPVAYEGVSKSCFSCGQLGHQNETCPYSIKPPSPPPKDSHVMSDAKVMGQTTANLEARTKAQTEERNALDSTNFDASIGPWMVVSRKGRKQKKMSSQTSYGKGIHHDKPKESFEIPSCNKFWAGPSEINESNGGRKALSELNTSLTLSCSLLDKLLTSKGLVSTGLE